MVFLSILELIQGRLWMFHTTSDEHFKFQKRRTTEKWVWFLLSAGSLVSVSIVVGVVLDTSRSGRVTRQLQRLRLCLANL